MSLCHCTLILGGLKEGRNRIGGVNLFHLDPGKKECRHFVNVVVKFWVS
jgi:hypothetical protein